MESLRIICREGTSPLFRMGRIGRIPCGALPRHRRGYSRTRLSPTVDFVLLHDIRKARKVVLNSGVVVDPAIHKGGLILLRLVLGTSILSKWYVNPVS